MFELKPPIRFAPRARGRRQWNLCPWAVIVAAVFAADRAEHVRAHSAAAANPTPKLRRRARAVPVATGVTAMCWSTSG